METERDNEAGASHLGHFDRLGDEFKERAAYREARAAGRSADHWVDSHPSPEVLDRLAEVGERARAVHRKAAADPLRQDEDAFTVRHCAEWCEGAGIGAEWVPVMVAALADDGPDSTLSWPTVARSVGATYTDGIPYR